MEKKGRVLKGKRDEQTISGEEKTTLDGGEPREAPRAVSEPRKVSRRKRRSREERRRQGEDVECLTWGWTRKRSLTNEVPRDWGNQYNT